MAILQLLPDPRGQRLIEKGSCRSGFIPEASPPQLLLRRDGAIFWSPDWSPDMCAGRGTILVPPAIRRPSDVNGASAGQRRRTLHCIVLRRSISRLFRPAHRCNLNANTLALSTLRRGAASSAF
jgi:hypothetical protein